METVFINTEKVETNKPHRFKLTLADKFNLKYPNRNMALANLNIYYTWKNIKSASRIIHLKYLLLLRMMNLIFLIDHILFQTFKIILNTSLKNNRIYQITLLYTFM